MNAMDFLVNWFIPIWSMITLIMCSIMLGKFFKEDFF